MYMDYMTLMPN